MHNVCLVASDPFGGAKAGMFGSGTGELMGALPELSAMPLVNLAYSRANEINVCSDELGIHGIQVSIQMHALDPLSFGRFAPDLGIARYGFQAIFQPNIAIYPVDLEPVGTMT